MLRFSAFLMLGALLLTGCEFCETRGTITFDNTRLFCNCDIEFPNGDEYVVFAGESQTYDFFAGSHTFHTAGRSVSPRTHATWSGRREGLRHAAHRQGGEAHQGPGSRDRRAEAG